jgi:hypothetical protein
LDRTTKSNRIVSAGFPRSGNTFLWQLLQQSFPKVNVIEFTHNVNTLDIKDCIVPLRNPYQAVPSWGAFSGEQNLEAIAKWYLRFNSKVFLELDNLLVIDFNQLSDNPELVIEKISNYFCISPIKIDVSIIDKNKKFKEYELYDSPTMQDCYNIYKEILEKL